MDPEVYLKPKNEGEKAQDYRPDLLCVSVWGVRVCVCVSMTERERKGREREGKRECAKNVTMCQCIAVYLCKV